MKSNNLQNLISEFFENHFYCEEIRDDINNKKSIADFSGGVFGAGVENYLKSSAWENSYQGKSRVYLVKEKKTGIIRAFFSIKCGMLYSPKLSESIEGTDRDFFEMLLEAVRNGDNELITDYASADLYDANTFKKMYDEAVRLVEYEKSLSDNPKNSYNVSFTYPAIEIENLCKNFEVKTEDIVPFGFLVFWKCIIPMIKKLSDVVGCEYIYIFAADKSDVAVKKKAHTLVTYYKTHYGFRDAEDLFFVKPDYDDKCYGLVQTVSDAVERSNTIWDQVEDIIDPTFFTRS